MVRHHVPERTGAIIMSAAMLDADGFRGGDLNVIDVAAIQIGSKILFPNRNTMKFWTVSLPRVMVDAVSLRLFERLLEVAVELACRFEIVAEGFLDNDPAPTPLVLLREGDGTQLAHGRREESGGHDQIKDAIAPSAMFLIRLLDLGLQALKGSGILKIALHVVNARQKPLPQIRIDGISCEFCDILGELLPERFGR